MAHLLKLRENVSSSAMRNCEETISVYAKSTHDENYITYNHNYERCTDLQIMDVNTSLLGNYITMNNTPIGVGIYTTPKDTST